MLINNKDFIEIEFTGKTKEGQIFDSNIKEDLKEIDPKAEPKLFTFCLGQNMFLKGIEDFLIGKEIGEYEIELKAKEAFGPRNPGLIQKMPIKIFIEQKLNPRPGITFNFDGRLGKVLTVSGGRILVDFNNPLAGRDIVYKIKVLRKVENIEERIKSLIDFFFRMDFKFEIEGKRVIIEAPKEVTKFIELFKDKFKEILNFDLEVKEIKQEKKENPAPKQ